MVSSQTIFVPILFKTGQEGASSLKTLIKDRARAPTEICLHRVN